MSHMPAVDVPPGATPLITVAVDGVTVLGDGTVANPLSSPAGITSIATDAISVFGDGSVANPLLSQGPYVDLRLPPYSVVANSISAAATNTAGINQAANDYNGLSATLALPYGTIYVDRANGTNNWCVKLGDIQDVELVGQGQFATTIAEYTAGDGGGSYTVQIDQCKRVAVHDFGVYQHTIGTPDPIQDNHLIGVTNTGAGVLKDVRLYNIAFGKSLGDQLRFLGDTSLVENVHAHHFVMHGAGVVASTPANGRVGSRSGIAFQRNFSRIEIEHFYIDGTQNSPFDMECTGSGTMQDAYIHDGWLDNSLGLTETAMSLGGVSGGDRANRITVRNVTVFGGVVNAIQCDNLTLDSVRIVTEAPVPTASTTPLLLIRQTCNDLVIRDCHLSRTGTSTNGNCLDLENAGSRTSIESISIVQGTTGYPIIVDGAPDLSIAGNTRIRYTGAAPTGKDAIMLNAVGGNLTNLSIDGPINVSSSTGKLQSAVIVQARSPRTVSNVRIGGIKSSGSATYGVLLSYGAGATCDLYPALQDIDNGTDAVYRAEDAAAIELATVFPQIAGNRGGARGIRWLVGTVTPEGNVTAPQGTLYTWINGDATRISEKRTGTGATGWIALT